MSTFENKEPSNQGAKSASTLKPNRAFTKQNREMGSILHLQRTIGNHATQRLLGANAGDPEGKPNTIKMARFNHDFIKIPASPERYRWVAEEKERQETATPGPPTFQQLRKSYFSDRLAVQPPWCNETLGMEVHCQAR